MATNWRLSVEENVKILSFRLLFWFSTCTNRMQPMTRTN